MRFYRLFVLLAMAIITCHAASVQVDPTPCDREDDSCPYPRDVLLRATGTKVKDCTSNDITNMDVSACKCQPTHNACHISCKVCGGVKKLEPTKHVHSCTQGCTDNEKLCKGCGIWFHTLCDCLQHPATCPTSKPVGGKAVWVYLEDKSGGDDLVTSTNLISGIEAMGNSAYDNEGWIYAQQKWDPGNFALALNSYRVRTMEQVHIHNCKKNQQTYQRISAADFKTYQTGHFQPLTGDKQMLCLAVPTGSTINQFSTSVSNYIKTTTECKDLVGAGMMKDDKGNTWGCVTINSAGPQKKFC